MLWRKGVIAILPCAGITLIRFTGIISDLAAGPAGRTPREPACRHDRH